MTEIKIGQLWQRPNGAVLRITKHRIKHGSHEYELTPVSAPKGMRPKRSWKWYRSIQNELTLIRTKI